MIEPTAPKPPLKASMPAGGVSTVSPTAVNDGTETVGMKHTIFESGHFAFLFTLCRVIGSRHEHGTLPIESSEGFRVNLMNQYISHTNGVDHMRPLAEKQCFAYRPYEHRGNKTLTKDIWSKVIPKQVVRKPRTMVIRATADAFRPWYRMNEVMSVAEEKKQK
jgi:hypothetical protein